MKVAELLYDVNRRLGTVTDYLLAQHGMALSDGEPKSVEVLINSMVNQTGAEAPPSFGRNGNMTGDKNSAPTAAEDQLRRSEIEGCGISAM